MGLASAYNSDKLDSEQKIPSVGSISGSFDRRFETHFASQASPPLTLTGGSLVASDQCPLAAVSSSQAMI